jgi:hypothetical protein
LSIPLIILLALVLITQFFLMRAVHGHRKAIEAHNTAIEANTGSIVELTKLGRLQTDVLLGRRSL